MSFHIMIPARLQSQRFPNKLVQKINNKTILEHTIEKALKTKAKSITVATADDKIAQIAKAMNVSVCITGNHHQSGTERITEAATLLKLQAHEIIVNVQADEPMLPAALIDSVADDLVQNPTLNITTLCQKIHHIKQLMDPNIVKVVLNKQQCAMYFSRAPIPWDRHAFETKTNTLQYNYFSHVGLYAYKVGFLQNMATLDTCQHSHAEMLEQLKILWHGHPILVRVSEHPIPHGIDTQQDLDNIHKHLNPVG